MKALRSFKIACLVCAAMLQALSSRAQLPTITNQPASRAIWAGGNASFTVGLSGNGPFTYQWQLNGSNLPAGIIRTVAGDGLDGFYGDGGPATNAYLLNPFGVAVDNHGSLFIADTGNYRIRKVDTNGIITTVAGNGDFNEFYGDGWPAIYAALNYPQGVSVDTNGNLFIADTSNQRIRKVGANGIITTVAGNGGVGFSGDDVAATNTGLGFPYNMMVDSEGDLLIADSGNSRIRKVNAKGIITTIAGNGIYTASGDGGPATDSSIRQAGAVAEDSVGNLFVADYASALIRKVDTNGIITLVAGLYSTWTNGLGVFLGDGGAATNASLFNPTDVAVDGNGNLFITDQNNHRVRKVDANGIIVTIAGNGTFSSSGDGGPATSAGLCLPCSIALDSKGDLFIADYYDERIREVTQPSYLPSLNINPASTANAGNYSVVITGSFGSITSSVACLTVTTSPLIYQTVPNSDGTVSLGFVCQPGSTNLVLCATNLEAPVVWQSISTNLAGADGTWQFTDTKAMKYRMRFYRSLTQ
jgi:sugar lactone lactonase YvrE